jgi:hypothetical protein
MRMLRILRGMLGSAIWWALAWTPLTLLAFGVISLFGGSVPPKSQLVSIVGQLAILGAMSGAAFSAILAVAARRRTFAQLTVPAMLIYGAVGGMLLPATMTALVALRFPSVLNSPGRLAAQLLFTGVLGAVCAVSSLYIARRAPTIDRPSPGEFERAPMHARDLTRVAADERR